MKLLHFTLAAFLCLFLINSTSAQTKMIAYKSHSGSAALMNEALLADLFSAPNSNLGAAPERYIRNAQLDSLIFLDDTSTVMVTSNQCINLRFRSKEQVEIWDAGRDTVHNHTIFNKELSEDTIREIIKNTYNFANDANDIVFVDQQISSVGDKKTGVVVEKKTPKKKGAKKNKKAQNTSKNKNPKKGLFKKPGCTTFIFLFCTLTFSLGVWKRRKP